MTSAVCCNMAWSVMHSPYLEKSVVMLSSYLTIKFIPSNNELSRRMPPSVFSELAYTTATLCTGGADTLAAPLDHLSLPYLDFTLN